MVFSMAWALWILIANKKGLEVPNVWYLHIFNKTNIHTSVKFGLFVH